MPRGLAIKTVALIDASAEILATIQPATVRAVCYKLFTQGLLPDMSKASTNRVSRALVIAREREMVSWDWIVDETRAPERVSSWDNPGVILEAVQLRYRKDRWTTQPVRIEVWSEKGTVRGTLAPVLNAYGVTFRVMHGYASATAARAVAQESRADARPFLAFYVGDWDPSGLHMSEVDLPERLREYDRSVHLRRLAIARDDRSDGLPSFPATDKRRDPRYGWFLRQEGRGVRTRCWELDALDPRDLRARVDTAIRANIDDTAWERSARAEAAEKESLGQVIGAWRRTKFGQASE